MSHLHQRIIEALPCCSLFPFYPTRSIYLLFSNLSNILARGPRSSYGLLPLVQLSVFLLLKDSRALNDRIHPVLSYYGQPIQTFYCIHNVNIPALHETSLVAWSEERRL